MDIIQQRLSFRTDFFLNDAFNSEHAIKYFDIFPINGNWSFTILICFLNQLPNFQKNFSLPFKKLTNNDYCARFSLIYNNNPQTEIIIFVGESIKVKATRTLITTLFKPARFWFFSQLRSWNKTRCHQKYQQHISYILFFNKYNDGTKAFFHHRPLVFCTPHDFSPVTYFFIKSIQKVGMPYIYDTFVLHEFFSMFFNESKQTVINSYEKFKENVNGYLKLTIQKSQIKKNLAKYYEKGVEYYIIGGIYISPYAQSLINNNSNIISCCLLDTTWKCLPYYVTSILMLSIKNTGIPISFAFGSSENKDLYQMHFTTFKSLYNIDLANFLFESDQGTSLIALFKEKNIKNFFCLRHLFANLKFNEYAFAVEQIVKCATQEEFDNCLLFYSEIFSYTIDKEQIKKRKKALSKVGLVFNDGLISIQDDDLWEKVSVLKRIQYKIPTTTNSLESFHGQLNSQTPRRNNFWTAMNRLARNIISKCYCIQDHISHNYMYEKKQTIDHAVNLGETRIKSEIQFYGTDINHCNCSGNKLLSEIYQIDFPCAHRFYIGSDFPECPKVNILFNSISQDLIVKTDPLPDDETICKLDIQTQDKLYIKSMIKRFGPCKKQDVISKYVDENYVHVNDDMFINDKPSFVLRLIHIGIQHFNELKGSKEDQNNS